MEASAFLRYLTNQIDYSQQIVHIEHIPPREPSYAELEEPLTAKLQDCLDKYGISSLYTQITLIADPVPEL